MTEVKTFKIKSVKDTDKIISKLKNEGYTISATSLNIKNKTYIVVIEKKE